MNHERLDTTAASSTKPAMLPMRDLVLLRLYTTPIDKTITRHDGSKVDLIIPTAAVHEEPMGVVLAIGPLCKLVLPGQLVLFDETQAIRADSNSILQIGHAARGNQVALDGPGQVLVAEKAIMAVLESEGD